MGFPVEPLVQQSKAVKPCCIRRLSRRLIADPVEGVFGVAGVLARNVFVGGQGERRRLAHPVETSSASSRTRRATYSLTAASTASGWSIWGLCLQSSSTTMSAGQ